jgi:uncharacterized circularly permuted ATP-grasp superfamily protein
VYSGLRYHLQKAHGLDDTEVLQYMPVLKKEYISGQTCIIEDCNTVLNSRSAHAQHIAEKHKLSAKVVKAKVHANTEFEVVIPAPRVVNERATAHRNRGSFAISSKTSRLSW